MKKLFNANKVFFSLLAGMFSLLLLAGLGLAAFIAPRSRGVSANPPPVQTLAPDSLFLGAFRPVQGTKYLVAEVHEEYNGGSRYSSGSWFDYNNSGTDGSTHNLVFLDGDTLASRKLFEDNERVIIAVSQFPPPILNEIQLQQMIVKGEEQSKDIITVLCLVLQVVQEDTNQDGRLNGADLQTVGITDAGGNGFAELFTGVSQVYWMEMTSPTSLVIVYQQEGQRKVSMIDTAKRSVTSTEPLVELGPEVK